MTWRMYFPQKANIAGRKPCATCKPTTTRGCCRTAYALRQKVKGCCVRNSPPPLSTDPFPALHTPREGRRDPWSPSMGPKIPQIQVPKFRKSEHQPFQGDIPTFFRHFPSGNGETSDFFEANIRGFASKVRRFGYKKSDVFGTFPRFLPSFFHAPAGSARQKRCRNPGALPHPAPQFAIYALQNTRIRLVFRAGRDTAHCHHF